MFNTIVLLKIYSPKKAYNGIFDRSLCSLGTSDYNQRIHLKNIMKIVFWKGNIIYCKMSC